MPIENLTKFAGVRHYQIVTGDDGDGFYAIIAKEGIDEELDFNEKSGDVVVISSETMGNNEELGAILMKSFIFALTDLENDTTVSNSDNLAYLYRI